MAFRPILQQKRFAYLKGVLAQTKTTLDQAAYDVIQRILEGLDKYQDVVTQNIEVAQSTAISNSANKFATYHTKNNDTSVLPNSIQLLAGIGITFDDSIPHERTIEVSGAGLGTHYDSPLSDGDTVTASLIFASGECIIVQVPI